MPVITLPDGSQRRFDSAVSVARLASDIGLEGAVFLADGRYRLPDGSERYLVSAKRLMQMTRGMGGSLLDPLKTTVVQEQRSMTTWVVRK